MARQAWHVKHDMDADFSAGKQLQKRVGLTALRMQSRHATLLRCVQCSARMVAGVCMAVRKLTVRWNVQMSISPMLSTRPILDIGYEAISPDMQQMT